MGLRFLLFRGDGGHRWSDDAAVGTATPTADCLPAVTGAPTSSRWLTADAQGGRQHPCQTRARSCGEPRGRAGPSRRSIRPRARFTAVQPERLPTESPSFPSRGLGAVMSGQLSWLALAHGAGSVAEAGGGATRHPRAWPVAAPAVVADCRRLIAAWLGRRWAVRGYSRVPGGDK